jgi:hypothetical protein
MKSVLGVRVYFLEYFFSSFVHQETTRDLRLFVVIVGNTARNRDERIGASTP